MNWFDIFLALVMTLIGSLIGIRKLALATLVCIAGYIAKISYSFHIPLANALVELNVKPVNAYTLSAIFLFAFVFFFSIYLGIKLVQILGLNDLGIRTVRTREIGIEEFEHDDNDRKYKYPESQTQVVQDSHSKVIDKVLGGGYLGSLFFILDGLFS